MTDSEFHACYDCDRGCDCPTCGDGLYPGTNELQHCTCVCYYLKCPCCPESWYEQK